MTFWVYHTDGRSTGSWQNLAGSCYAGLVAGGNWPHPGEISPAYRGLLFLDELPEFEPGVLEVMRQPIEDKILTISRTQGSLTFPANFQLIGAMNPCPCGYFGDTVKPCTCHLVMPPNIKNVSRIHYSTAPYSYGINQVKTW